MRTYICNNPGCTTDVAAPRAQCAPCAAWHRRNAELALSPITAALSRTGEGDLGS